MLSKLSEGNNSKADSVDLDEIDRRLLVALQEDSKRSIKELADEVGLTKTPVYERIRRMEEEGVIQRYVAIVDKQKVPSHMVAFCSVNLHNQAAEFVDEFVDLVRSMPEVLDCFIIGGDFDVLLRVVCTDLQAYFAFVTGTISAISNVAHTRSFFVIAEAKSTTAWPIVMPGSKRK